MAAAGFGWLFAQKTHKIKSFVLKLIMYLLLQRVKLCQKKRIIWLQQILTPFWSLMLLPGQNFGLFHRPLAFCSMVCKLCHCFNFFLLFFEGVRQFFMNFKTCCCLFPVAFSTPACQLSWHCSKGFWPCLWVYQSAAMLEEFQLYF